MEKFGADLNNFLREKEEDAYNKLGIIKRSFITNDNREKDLDLFHADVMRYVENILIKSNSIKKLNYLLEEHTPDLMQKTLSSVLSELRANLDGNNMWLLKEIDRIKELKSSKDIDFSNYQANQFFDFTNLIMAGSKVYIAEIAHRKINGHLNEDIERLKPFVKIPFVDDFVCLSNDLLSSRVNNDIYTNKFYVEDKINECVSQIKLALHLRLNDRYWVNENFNIEIKDIFKQSLKEEYLHNFLLADLLKIKQQDYSEQVISPLLLREISENNNMINKAISDALNNYKNYGIDLFIENINQLIKSVHKVYQGIELEEYIKFFKEQGNSDINMKFIIISTALEDDDLINGLIKSLNDDELKNLIGYKEKFNDVDFIFEVVDDVISEIEILSGLANTEWKKRYSENQIKAFENGGDNLNLKSTMMRKFTVDFKVLNSLFKYSLNTEKINKVVSEKYKMEVINEECSLFLYGDYVNSLKDEDVINIFISLIKDNFMKNKGNGESLIHEKELNFKINNKKLDNLVVTAPRRKV